MVGTVGGAWVNALGLPWAGYPDDRALSQTERVNLEEVLVPDSPKLRRVNVPVSAAHLFLLVPEEVLGPKYISFFLGNI